MFGPPDAAIKGLDDLKGKTISVTRGAIEDIELTKVAPRRRDHQTLRRQQLDHRRLPRRASRPDCQRQRGDGGDQREKNPKRVPALKVKLKDSPVYVGVNKNEPALLGKVNDILTTAKADGALEKEFANLAERAAAGRSLIVRAGDDLWLISSISCRWWKTPTCCCAVRCSPLS
ncbi:hypothetical protein ACFS4T_33210 [Pseudomonas lini]